MTRNDISVAMIEPVGGHGGMEHYDLGLCRGLLAAGCRVSLYTCDKTAAPGVAGLGFHPVYKRVFGGANRWLRGLRYFLGTLASLALAVKSGERICHLHVFHGSVPEMMLVLLAKLSRRKVVITVHDVESFDPSVATSRKTVGRLYGLADGLIVHNESSRREIMERLGVPTEKISVIPHGNYLDAVKQAPQSAEARLQLGLGEPDKVVLFFGQIKDVKGLDILLEATPAVAREIPQVTLLIAGRPWKSDFSKYETLIDELGIRDRCRLNLRYIPDGEMGRYFAAADVVVLPYRRIYQSGVVLLAMSYGRPVLVSDLPGMTEIVTDRKSGYVFAQGSKDSLSEQLIRVLRHDGERQQVAACATEHVRQNHDWEKIGKKTADLYSSILST